MTSYHMQMLFNLLPQELKEKAISLEEFGLNEYIWKWHDTLQLIEILSNKQKFILGGDVISNYDGKYKETDDGWYIEKTNYLASEDDIQRSQIISIDYINNFVKINGEDFYFSIVVDFK